MQRHNTFLSNLHPARVKTAGFTLLELIIVIVILGVLAVTAAPQFFNFSREANMATLQGLHNALQSGVQLTYIKATTAQVADQDLACIGGKFDTLDSQCSENGILVRYGYPVATRENISRVVNLDDWESNELSAGGDQVSIAANTSLMNRNCYVVYRLTAGNEPAFSMVSTGC